MAHQPSAGSTLPLVPNLPPQLTLDIKDLSFGDQRLLANTRLLVPAGDFTLLMGRSGSGKTTLLRLLAGLPVSGAQRPTQGTIGAATGRTTVQWKLSGNEDLTLAYMGQGDSLLPWCNLVRNVAVGSYLRGNPSGRNVGKGNGANREQSQRKIRVRAMEFLDRVGLADRAFCLPATLSGGERQRVALARTLFEDRELVLLDEPFASLDALTRLELQDWAFRLLRSRTVLWVTHDPTEAFRMADHLVVISNGRLVAIDLPAPNVEQPEAKHPRIQEPRSIASPELARELGRVTGRLLTLIEHANPTKTLA